MATKNIKRVWPAGGDVPRAYRCGEIFNGGRLLVFFVANPFR